MLKMAIFYNEDHFWFASMFFILLISFKSIIQNSNATDMCDIHIFTNEISLVRLQRKLFLVKTFRQLNTCLLLHWFRLWPKSWSAQLQLPTGDSCCLLLVLLFLLLRLFEQILFLFVVCFVILFLSSMFRLRLQVSFKSNKNTQTNKQLSKTK